MSQHQTAAIRDVHLAYTATGTGPMAVWAHALTSSSWAQEHAGEFDWQPISDAGKTLVRYDARGHGKSTGSPLDTDYQWENLALDLLALINKLSPGAPVAGIGSSMGTATLLHAAVLPGQHFTRLVLTSPPTAWASRAAQAHKYRQTADLAESAGAAAFGELLATYPVPPFFADLPGYPPPLDVNNDLLLHVLRGAGSSDLPSKEALAQLQLPVLVLAWTGDPMHPKETAVELANAIPGAELRVASTPHELSSWGHIAAKFLSAD
jgi:3-oxoadipate enol-lactonase